MSENSKDKSKNKGAKKEIAVILFNLGGPDKKESVKPFLFNLFYDKYIITLPKFFRYMIAWLISSRREKTAQEIYSHIGDKSPILEETNNQANLLEKSLNEDDLNQQKKHYKVFVCMRHWHPMSPEVINNVKEYAPDEVIMLPLYPQLSTTTSVSSIEDFQERIDQHMPSVMTKVVCCYPRNKEFISSHKNLLLKSLESVKEQNNYRILFSAHGLPKKTIKSGDPYQWQIEETVRLIMQDFPIKDVDYKVTYQSRVGPLEWIGPNTEDEIENAGKEKKDLVIVPVAFVSEHSETLVELDIEYKEIADKHAINYVRVPTLSSDEHFISALKGIVQETSDFSDNYFFSDEKKSICPDIYTKCPCRGKKLC